MSITAEHALGLANKHGNGVCLTNKKVSTTYTFKSLHIDFVKRIGLFKVNDLFFRICIIKILLFCIDG